jgi:hypothetical protein
MSSVSSYRGGKAEPVYLPHWRYLGGEAIVLDGSGQTATIPTSTQIFVLRAETEDVNYVINSIVISPPSPGFVPRGGLEVAGPLTNLAVLTVRGTVGGIAHIQYFREDTPGS